MGNSCCRSGEASSTSMVSTPRNTEKESLLLDHHHNFSSLSSSSNSYREMKIKITKKQLEELLGRAEVYGISVDQVLARLINDKNHEDHFEIHYQRSWRPVLQTIPEVN